MGLRQDFELVSTSGQETSSKGSAMLSSIRSNHQGSHGIDLLLLLCLVIIGYITKKKQ